MAMTDRYNIYVLIHKGLRAWMCDVLATVGRMDPYDVEDVTAGLGKVRALLAGCESHLLHENEYLHPAIEARCPGGASAAAHDHDHHLRALAALESAVRAAEVADGSARAIAVLRLYRELAVFIAENFEHMHREETENHAALVAHYSETEVFALEQAIVGSLTPEEKMTTMRWMAPSAAPHERAMLLSGLRLNAPRPAFDAVVSLVRPFLTGRDWDKLAVALGPMPVAETRTGELAAA
ncbi:MAG: hemerythrin domain-containing protein [Burkholderiaceae bacterium]|jgi:ribosomal protein L30E|nr:hemerythrin domain-containing protein [Burkholderiaceae bacterium]